MARVSEITSAMGRAGSPEAEVAAVVDAGDELGVALPANVVTSETLLDPPPDDAAHVGTERGYGVGVGVQGLPVEGVC